jgi:hypothetical protein
LLYHCNLKSPKNKKKNAKKKKKKKKKKKFSICGANIQTTGL